jgi:lipoprotein-releasing system permease protein
MTNWPVILKISKKHLLSRLKQSSIAALGVTFGIGTFILLMSFMTGLNKLLDGLILNRTPHIHIYNELKPSEQQPVDLYEAFKNELNVVHSVRPKLNQAKIHNAVPLMNNLKKDAKVKGAIPEVRAQVFYISGAIELNGVVNGVDILEESRLFDLDDYIVQGSPNALANSDDGIIIGAGIAKKMSLQIGNRIQVSTAKGGVFPLKIVGIYQSGLADIDETQSYANLNTAQQLLGEGANYITDINVKLYDIEDAMPMSQSISKQFNLTAIDIKSANAQFETGTSVRLIITYSVSVTLLIVAGFGIYNILNMLIYEKMNDIAILKATGFSGNDVKMIFISEALIIGIIGGGVGLILGYTGSVVVNNIPFKTQALPTIKTFPVNFNPLFYFVGIVFAMISTFLAGYLPARRAQKIDPVEIIRGQ